MVKIKEKKDRFHHPVEIGDTVVFVKGQYKGSNVLDIGEVVRLMNIQIEIKDRKGGLHKKDSDKYAIFNAQQKFNQHEFAEFYI